MNTSPQKPYVGGQAVIEGVMMRSPRCLAVAVRRPNGTIIVREDAWISLLERLRFLRWPFLRGAVVLIESLYNGIQALNFAAQHAAPDESAEKGDSRDEIPSRLAAVPADLSKAADSITSIEATKKSDAGVAATIALSFAIAIALFVGLPHLLTWGAGRATGVPLDVDGFEFHAIDGAFKILIFVGYILTISRIPEIRRVFEYHGAEHKVVNAYENGQELTVENAQKWTTFHARCGTSFVLFVLVLSIFMFAAVFPLVPRVSEADLLNHVAMILLKVPLMLPLSGIAYEINRYAAAHPRQLWVQGLVLPGRLMQNLTTREPDANQLEIALAAMRAALSMEARLTSVDVIEARALVRAQPPAGHVAVFRNYAELQEAIPAGR